MTDAELIRAYAEQHSEPAFAELVNRYLGFVYASALRQVQQPDLAADVAQAVFLLLSRKATSLRREVVLSGWLFRTTRFLAARTRRSEVRRQHREQEAAIMNLQNEASTQTENFWREITPHLDDAVAALSEADRRTVLLRYFERKPLREVGNQLGITEEAAKKRVTRAVDKLRAFLTGRGVTLTSVTLGTLLLESRSQAAPGGLAQAICVAAATGVGLTGVSSAVAALVAAGVRDLFWVQAKAVAPWAAGAAAVLLGLTVWVSGRDSVPNEGPATSSTTIELSPATQSGGSAATIQPAPKTRSQSGRRFLLNVRDRESNEPVQGARALANVWGREGDESSKVQTSGPDGSCVFGVPDKPFQTFRVWLSAAGYVPVVMDWQAHEFTEADVLYTCKLTRGATLTGEVRDEEGRPVTEAKIYFSGPGVDMTKRENIGYLQRFTKVVTDRRGQFQCNQIPPAWDGNLSVGVKHPDFVSAATWLRDATALATNLVITLTRGVALRGQVIGPRGDPVPDASLQADEKMFNPETKTDAQGQFEFAHVSPGAHTVTVRANGYAQLEKTLLAETNCPEVTLQLAAALPGTPYQPSPLRLVGTVLDAESGEPIQRFKVLLNERRGVSNRLLGEGANGSFDWTTEMMFVEKFSLVVEADGFQPQESDERPLTDKEQEFEFRLKRGSDLTGVVVQPDGQPAVGASLALAADGKFGTRLTDGGKLVNYGHPVNRTTSDEHGRISLRPMVGAEQLLVAHETGCAVLPVASVTNVTIQLQAWGRIEGVLNVGDSPAADQSVNVGFGAVPGETRLITFDYNTKTDAEGKFSFTHVPPGMHRVQRLIKFYKGKTGRIGFSHGETVTVRPGETTHVVLGGKGMAVVGRLALSPPIENYDWSMDLHALVQQRPDLPEIKWQDFRGDDAARTRAWSLRDSQIAKYYLRIEPDGRFRTDDVLPGNYVLQVKIEAPPKDPLAEDAWMRRGREIGQVNLPVIIAGNETREAIDLGIVTIPITNPPPATASGRMTVPLFFPGKDKP